jgi:hypothetical protein
LTTYASSENVWLHQHYQSAQTSTTTHNATVNVLEHCHRCTPNQFNAAKVSAIVLDHGMEKAQAVQEPQMH